MTQQAWPKKASCLAKRKSKFGHLIGLLFLLSVTVLLLSGAWAAADAGPRVRDYLSRSLHATSTRVEFNPSSLELSQGQITTVDLMVYDVVDLCGFELQISFDPSVVRIIDADPEGDGVNITPGDFINPYFLVENICDNTAGTIDICIIQTFPQPPRTGTGRLASIILEAVGPGNADFQFEGMLLSNQEGRVLAGDTFPPSFVVLGGTPDGPSPTATSTPTSSATPTPTATTSATPYYYLDPQILELGTGETGEMVIRTSYVEDLSGVAVYLRWNPALVHVVDANPSLEGDQIMPGNLFEGYSTYRPPHEGNAVDNLAGQLSYVLLLTGQPAGVSGEWSVATITFQAVGFGSCTVEFYGDTLMTGSDGLSIPSGWFDGEVRVVSQTSTPTPIVTVPSPTDTPVPTITPPTPTATAPTPTPTQIITCWDRIGNGGFETIIGNDAPPWVRSGATTYSGAVQHAGTNSAWLGGYDNATDGVYQVVILPSNTTASTLTYWWYMETTETDHPHDYLYVEILDSEGQLLDTLETRSDGDQAGTWQSSVLDLSTYVGQTISLSFRLQANDSAYTSFYLDDVSLQVCFEGMLSQLHLPLTFQGVKQ